MFENVISVCYHSGTCGHAIGIVIQLSPEVYRRGDVVYQSILPSGEIYDYGLRCGRADYSNLDFDINRCFEHFGGWYMQGRDIPQTHIDHYQSVLPSLWLRPRRVRFLDAIKQDPFLIADHTLAKHQQQLLPGCKTIAVYGNEYLALRYYADKKYIPPDVDDPLGRPGIESFTSHKAATHTRSQRYRESMEYFLHNSRRVNWEHQNDTKSFRLDYEELLFSERSKDVYHDMIKWLGLTPNWPAASAFIEEYQSKQLNRLTRQELLRL